MPLRDLPEDDSAGWRRRVTARGAALGLCLLLPLGMAACTEPGESSAPPVQMGSCKTPSVKLQPAEGAPGSTVSFTGEWFVSDCGTGASGGKPAQDIGIAFTDAAGNAQGLTNIDATGSTGTITGTFTVPADAAKGEGRVTFKGATPVPFEVTG